MLASIATALATGLGALPLLRYKEMSPAWVALSSAVAGGAMIGAAISLVFEGGSISLARVVIGGALGALFVWITRRALGRRPDLHLGALKGANARRGLLILGVMTLHSFTEGVGVGVSFAGDREFGLFIALAIAVHNVPEGLAISLALVPNGTTVKQAAGWSIFSSLPQPLMAVPAYLGVEVFEPLLPAGLGFAGGAMAWMVIAYMLPEAMTKGSRLRIGVATAAGAVGMLVVGALLST